MDKIHNNLTIENLTKTSWFNQFDKLQQREILKGLELNLDISIYAKECFNYAQMYAIRTGLEKNLDVSIYAKDYFDVNQMLTIRKWLEDNLDVDVSIYVNKYYNYKKNREKLENEQNT